MTVRILPDTSFLSHSLVPSQRVGDSTQALRAALDSEAEVFSTVVIVVEFFSLLRKLVNRGVLPLTDAAGVRRDFSATIAAFLPITEHDAHAGFLLATRLGQSDIFDATGYIVAERHDVEFWVSDRSVLRTQWARCFLAIAKGLRDAGYKVQYARTEEDSQKLIEAGLVEVNRRRAMPEESRIDEPTIILVLSEPDRIGELSRTDRKSVV